MSFWPTVFVIDAKSVIRFRLDGYGSYTSKLIGKKVDELLAEAAKG